MKLFLLGWIVGVASTIIGCSLFIHRMDRKFQQHHK